MSHHVLKTIEDVNAQIRAAEQEAFEKKQIVNSLCGIAKIPLQYPDAQVAGASGSDALARDTYYGQKMGKVIRLVLERRKRAGLGAAKVNEIYDDMVAGGFNFKSTNDDYAKRGLYQSLTKNSGTFHKLPNGTYGLLSWYPGVKPSKTSKADLEGDTDGEVEDVDAGCEDRASFEDVVEELVVSGAEESDAPPNRPR